LEPNDAIQPDEIKCQLCGATGSATQRMVGLENTFICERCVKECVGLLNDDKPEDSKMRLLDTYPRESIMTFLWMIFVYDLGIKDMSYLKIPDEVKSIVKTSLHLNAKNRKVLEKRALALLEKQNG